MPRKYRRKTTSRSIGRRGKRTKPNQLKNHFPSVARLHHIGELDKRSALYKAIRKTENEIIDDLGGEDEASHIQRAIITRFAWLEAMVSTIEWEVATERRELNLETMKVHAYLTQVMKGVATTLGVEKRARAVHWTGPVIPELLNNRRINDVAPKEG